MLSNLIGTTPTDIQKITTHISTNTIIGRVDNRSFELNVLLMIDLDSYLYHVRETEGK